MKKFKNKFLVPVITVCMVLLAYFGAPEGEPDAGQPSQQAYAGEDSSGTSSSGKDSSGTSSSGTSSMGTSSSGTSSGASSSGASSAGAASVGVSSVEEVPDYSGEPYVIINGNQPNFSDIGSGKDSFEDYSPLDDLGRCGVAYASLCLDTMPTEARGDIGQVRPSGWQSVKYDCVDGKYLYNRCHLIGFQLSAENANRQNLITGTRYLNVQGMLPFENMVADYIKETGNHVLYRVIPVFEGDNLVASGVQMEALSVEDEGDGICFNVYCYNVQPMIVIDYATGESSLSAEAAESEWQSYILNTKTKKFHAADCSSVADIQEENRQEYRGSREALTAQGYEPCGRCKP